MEPKPFEPFPPSVHDQTATCKSCKRTLLLESVSHEARQVYIQIEHTAKRNLGLCPPAEEIAQLMGWPQDRVGSALLQLVEQKLLKPFPGRKGDYRAAHYGLRDTLEEQDIEIRKLRRALEEEQSHRREAAQVLAGSEAKSREMAKLEERVENQNRVIKALNHAKVQLEAQLQDALSRLPAQAQAATQPQGSAVAAGV